ncbi:MAG TPA: CpsB/CapC family capsule biosynthesis tyrosine phosphatase [Thermoanaerobaculia bacterium]|nr:CpsB/CapC family capsule biosynthesis tyrosine phosphatase [Thermoanaerobaculia bacterium]
MIDLHSHVIPGVDDGARDLGEAVAMCRMAIADGCTSAFATPHLRHPSWWNGDRSELERRLASVRAHVGPSLELHPGGEIRADANLLDEVDRLPSGSLLSLGGSRYLLIELDRSGMGPDPLPLVHELVLDRWRPILAHPEHFPWLMTDPSLLTQLADAGALFQITAMSLLGGFGPRPERWCRKLIGDGLAHFVASDAHDTVRRPPGLSAARERISSLWGRELARHLTVENPRAVVENRPLPTLTSA